MDSLIFYPQDMSNFASPAGLGCISRIDTASIPASSSYTMYCPPVDGKAVYPSACSQQQPSSASPSEASAIAETVSPTTPPSLQHPMLLSYKPYEAPLVYAIPYAAPMGSSPLPSSGDMAVRNATAPLPPDAFCAEFHQYSKETFEVDGTQQPPGGRSKKRRRTTDDDDEPQQDLQPSDEDECASQQPNTTRMTAEVRRQIHIQSEQKRRAQIKEGFEELRNELPACLSKKMSKVTLLSRTVHHIQHLKASQMAILAELERLARENEQLRKFQQSVLQQA